MQQNTVQLQLCSDARQSVVGADGGVMLDFIAGHVDWPASFQVSLLMLNQTGIYWICCYAYKPFPEWFVLLGEACNNVQVGGTFTRFPAEHFIMKTRSNVIYFTCKWVSYFAKSLNNCNVYESIPLALTHSRLHVSHLNTGSSKNDGERLQEEDLVLWAVKSVLIKLPQRQNFLFLF